MARLPKNITKEDYLSAIRLIDENGVGRGENSLTYDLIYEGKNYPPKLVYSLANKFANGEILDRNSFKVGKKSPCFNQLEKVGFEIVEKQVSIVDIAKQFILDSNAATQETKHYPKLYKGLSVSVSFGQGNFNKVPWVAFLKDGQEVTKGIYPVLHIYKEFNCLVLGYGISKKNKPASSWNKDSGQSINDYLTQKYGAENREYSESYICGAYDIEKPLDKAKLESDMTKILKDYENANFVPSVSNVSEPDSPYITKKEERIMPPLNQILYGPPGTGKTYHTIEAAVEAADPTYYSTLGVDKEIGASVEQREGLKKRFDELSDDQHIQFVTFHQSFSYEEFVEGLRAETHDKQISYFIKDGIFKSICNTASGKTTKADIESSYSLDGKKIWKMSLGNTLTDEGQAVFDECRENNYILLGYGHDIDFTACDSKLLVKAKLEESGETLKRQDYTLTAVNTFKNRIKKGDLVIVSDGNSKYQGIAEITGDYSYLNEEEREGFWQSRPVKWLLLFDKSRSVKEIMHSKNLSQMTLYNLKDSVVSREKIANLLLPQSASLDDNQLNYVLIIDEINRANISKVFGELITLIEPTKRAGHKEELSLSLPYSQEDFFVPNNLYILGTMNTADRSLAMMDTALRRRFDFIEMMPDLSVLENCTVKGIKIDELVRIMNERIETLYDREHTLGHAFFIPVKEACDIGNEDVAWQILQSIFQNKILPLLEEYFFEDWEKIRLVLGDNQKLTDVHQFVIKEELNSDKLKSLFGGKYKDDNYLQNTARYSLNKSAFSNDKAYKYIITGEPTVKSPDVPKE